MAGAGKKRNKDNRRDKQSGQNDDGSTSNPATGSDPQSIAGVDGNRDPEPVPRQTGASSRAIDHIPSNDLKNISDMLGHSGWYAARGLTIPLSTPQRPSVFNSQGREAFITLNTFNVVGYPSKKMQQYDVVFSGDSKDYTKRGILKKIWESEALQGALGQTGDKWIWDGNKLCWSSQILKDSDNGDGVRIKVDLNAEQGKGSSSRSDIHQVQIRWTRWTDFSMLQSFLDGRGAWDTACIDTINCLDHLLREGPSKKFSQIKKSFFQRGQQRFDLGGGIEAFKGVFMSLRPVLDDKFKRGLSVNVDVANGTFWKAQPLKSAVTQSLGCNESTVASLLNSAKGSKFKESKLRKDLRRFKHVGVSTTHMKHNVQYTIDEFVGGTAYEVTFTPRDSPTVTVAKYFKDTYKITVDNRYPVVRITKKINGGPIYMPVDVLNIDQNQRYTPKLDSNQTSGMIKFAVTPPAQRWNAIQTSVNLLNWGSDDYLKHYGLNVTTQPSRVKARILPVPNAHLAQGTLAARDLVQGRWRLDGKKFAKFDKLRPIAGWGICIVQDPKGGRMTVQQVEADAFVKSFVQIYEGHGGRISAHPQQQKKPFIQLGNLVNGGQLVENLWNGTGKTFQRDPTLLIFVVPDTNAETYRRIKKSCDCRYGVASQVLLAKHVKNNQAQYISNVCLKVFAKFGGGAIVTKSTVLPKIAPRSAQLSTMIIGADVSHPAPGALGGEAASFAAITMSADKEFVTYWAEVQTNGHRADMIKKDTWKTQFKDMIKKWMVNVNQGKAPDRILYIRDGVSEAQYAAVLAEEVENIKEVWKTEAKSTPKITVVIAGKRHHIRFFPDKGKGDRNDNPLPGTLVESGCTHPFEFDFYLCAHAAIKGTARPVHYHCILNEAGYASQELQSVIFEHSFQFVRATTPVSLHPAVYYAHIAADRARAHLRDQNAVTSGKKESKAGQDAKQSSDGSGELIVAPITPLLRSRGLADVMWYI